MTMKAGTIGVLAFSVLLAACNSKPAEQANTSAEASQPAPSMAAPVAAATTAVAMKAAPEGLPSRVAREAITAGGHKCAGVANADRDKNDGTIVAKCTSGESYRIYTEEGKGAVATAM